MNGKPTPEHLRKYFESLMKMRHQHHLHHCWHTALVKPVTSPFSSVWTYHNIILKTNKIITEDHPVIPSQWGFARQYHVTAYHSYRCPNCQNSWHIVSKQHYQSQSFQHTSQHLSVCGDLPRGRLSSAAPQGVPQIVISLLWIVRYHVFVSLDQTTIKQKQHNLMRSQMISVYSQTTDYSLPHQQAWGYINHYINVLVKLLRLHRATHAMHELS